MTKHIVVAVYDSAVQAYGRPIFVPSVGAAMRSFQDEVNRKAEDNPMWAHPDDYEMFALGAWDDLSGMFEGNEGGPVSLTRAKDMVLNRENQS